MMKTYAALFAIMVLSGIMVLPVSAARSLTKSFKLSVTLPSSVKLPNSSWEETNPTSEITPRQTTEKSVVIRHNEKILLQTTVAQ